MAKNKGSTRKGAVKDRSQVFNEKTGMYIKRDKKTGRFISCKKTKYKGIINEKKIKKKKLKKSK